MGSQSNLIFWLKRIAVMLAVMAAAVSFLLYVPEPGIEAQGTSEAPKKSKSVSESVTRFYSEFRQSSGDPIKEKYGEFTILLEEQNDQSIDQVIEEVSQRNFPEVSDWSGAYRERSFPQNSTLKNKAMEYAAQEGFSLVWDLNQDFIIRHRFLETGTLIDMLEGFAQAVDSHFNRPIKIYFCQKKRAFVITERDSAYLVDNCQKSYGLEQAY